MPLLAIRAREWAPLDLFPASSTPNVGGKGQPVAGEKQQFDRTFCEYVVRAYLAGQGWSLVDAAELSDAIWQDLRGKGPVGAQAVQTAVWEHYAVVIHDHCRRPASDQHDAAWSELKAWLARQAPKVNDDPRDQEEIVQETLIDLERRLDETPLHAPRALWAYALATLKRNDVDLYRKRTAEKRGEGKVGSLEGLAAAYQEEEDAGSWEESLQAAGQRPGERSTERTVVEREVREQLQALFREYFSSEWQLRVAEAHFLDDLRPAEIAELTGKSPHEIRMVKARAVRKLRNLPADERERLLEILAGAEEEK